MTVVAGLFAILVCIMFADAPAAAGDLPGTAPAVDGPGPAGCSACALRKQRLKRRATEREAESLSDSDESARYRCAGDTEIQVALIAGGSGSVRVQWRDTNLTLPHVPAASGARYDDGQTMFWTKGSEAMLERDGDRWTCERIAP